MLPKLFSVLVLVLIVNFVNAQGNGPIVNITQGEVEGRFLADYVAFYGIPYAGSVTGENRFKAPPPPENFQNNYYNAAVENTRCAQPSSSGLVGDENCLFLNILTKNTTGSRPVMVWLMGEDYNHNSYESLDFSRFVDAQDILVVTLNYRLSIFGFLCLGVEEAPGNAGLKDVIAGLRWIRGNIASFGGDPNNIMLVGHGSGAAMVDLVTLSPLSIGLVHKAIVQSGSALSPWAVSYNPVDAARRVAERLNITETDDQSQLAIHIRNTPLSVLLPALEDPVTFNSPVLFAPCVENSALESEEHFMTRDPLTIIRSGEYSQIPFITGFTTGEGSVRAHQAVHLGWLEQMEINFENFIPVNIDLAREENRTDIINEIRRFYFQEQPISFENINDYLNFHGDILTLVPVIRTAAERAVTSRAEVRLYEFGYVGTWGEAWPFPTIPISNRARHGHEITYLLGIRDTINVENDRLNTDVQNSLTRRWATFARNNNPVAVQGPGQVVWETVTASSTRYLEYANVIEGVIENARADPHSQRMTFWNDLFASYYVAPQPVSSASSIFSCTFIIMIFATLVRLV